MNDTSSLEEEINVIQRIADEATSQDNWQMIGIGAIRVVLILVISRLVVWIIHKAIDHMIIEREVNRLPIQARRMKTVGKLLKNVLNYVIYFIAGMLVLAEFNINLMPLLAGAGVLGLAIGFGAQSLVKDVITGFFIILEDQFAVGDVIQTGQFKGTVEVIGLRATRLQSWTGEVHIIPNGLINEVTNYSLHNTLAVVDIAIAYEEDIDKATEVIRGVVDGLEDDNLMKQPEVLGLQLLNSSEVTVRIIAECRPTTDAIIGRKIRTQVKKALDEHGIDIPYPRTVTYHRGERGGLQGGA
ncbi:mechanosensitive ion channel family protein [Paenibacillus sp. GCM10023252]|uniref:mechanosensitive ion channel family protein n=1 Tax=Paenibacillus sp. GCM10023252 TaxID=3252649 RepID=UPI00361E0801